MSVAKTLSRAKAIASLLIPVGFNSLLLCHITTSTGFNVSFVGETGGFEEGRTGDLLAGCSGWRGELLTGCVGKGCL